MKKLGIQRLMLFVGFALTLTKEVKDGLDDGKFSFGETLGLVDNAAEIPELVKNAKYIPAEIADLDAEEQEQLHQYVRDNFDLENDKVEQAIEESIDLAFYISRYAVRLGRIFKKDKAA